MSTYEIGRFFQHYALADRYADNGEYSHTDLVRRSDGATVIEDCYEGGKNIEHPYQPDKEKK